MTLLDVCRDVKPHAAAATVTPGAFLTELVVYSAAIGDHLGPWRGRRPPFGTPIDVARGMASVIKESPTFQDEGVLWCELWVFPAAVVALGFGGGEHCETELIAFSKARFAILSFTSRQGKDCVSNDERVKLRPIVNR